MDLPFVNRVSFWNFICSGNLPSKTKLFKSTIKPLAVTNINNYQFTRTRLQSMLKKMSYFLSYWNVDRQTWAESNTPIFKQTLVLSPFRKQPLITSTREINSLKYHRNDASRLFLGVSITPVVVFLTLVYFCLKHMTLHTTNNSSVLSLRQWYISFHQRPCLTMISLFRGLPSMYSPRLVCNIPY